MGPRFDDVIPFFGDTVLAIGPLHGPLNAGDKILEVCAWVFQSTEDHAQDAAATEMTTNLQRGGGHETFRQSEGRRWLLPLKKLENSTDFREGRAFAVAVAFHVDMSDSSGGTMPRVMWWGQPVDLVEDQARVVAATAASDDILDTNPLLKAPMPPTDGS